MKQRLQSGVLPGPPMTCARQSCCLVAALESSVCTESLTALEVLQATASAAEAPTKPPPTHRKMKMKIPAARRGAKIEM